MSRWTTQGQLQLVSHSHPGGEIAMLSRWLLTLLSPHITFSALPQYRDPGQVTALLYPTQSSKHPPCTSGNISLSELCIFALV